MKLKEMKISLQEIKESYLEETVKEMSNLGGPHGSMASLCLHEWENGVMKTKFEDENEDPNPIKKTKCETPRTPKKSNN